MAAQINVGQKIYVNYVSFASTKPNLKELEVTKVNKSSFYLREPNSNIDIEWRFSLKTMTCKIGLETMIAYIDPDVYWNTVKISNEKKDLRESIQQSLNSLSYKKLKEIKEVIDKNEKGVK
ncbi:hypothetical protein KLEB273_gp170 [Bacillus phage vB_BauM_KLEB27-3]|nr:hypothetical protein KLEB273_gp170 [Bacillus phage vB_BauM_KLEB27-3]